MNSTQQRVAVVERMYSNDLGQNYLGSLSILDPEVLISSLLLATSAICTLDVPPCLYMAPSYRGLAAHKHSRCSSFLLRLPL